MDLDLVIADVKVRLIGTDPFTCMLSRGYMAGERFGTPDLVISATDEDMAEVEAENSSEPLGYDVINSYALLENLDMAMLDFDAFYLHASSIAMDGKAYLFSAKSGTGKSTHAALWKEYFGDDAQIINGDRPFIREKEGIFYAYGSPWAGKEGLSMNKGFPIAGICFMERGTENRICTISHAEVIDRIFRQIRLPHDESRMGKLLRLLDRLVTSVPCYVLYCNISKEAVETSYKGMGGEREL